MPRPMPREPPVTNTTDPVKSSGSVVAWSLVWAVLMVLLG